MADAAPKAKTPPKAQAACFLRRVAGYRGLVQKKCSYARAVKGAGSQGPEKPYN
jgi:hypothetical protein